MVTSSKEAGMNQIEITQSAQRILDQAHREMAEHLCRQDVQRTNPGISDGDADRIIVKLRNHAQTRIVG